MTSNKFLTRYCSIFLSILLLLMHVSELNCVFGFFEEYQRGCYFHSYDFLPVDIISYDISSFRLLETTKEDKETKTTFKFNFCHGPLTDPCTQLPSNYSSMMIHSTATQTWCVGITHVTEENVKIYRDRGITSFQTAGLTINIVGVEQLPFRHSDYFSKFPEFRIKISCTGTRNDNLNVVYMDNYYGSYTFEISSLVGCPDSRYIPVIMMIALIIGVVLCAVGCLCLMICLPCSGVLCGCCIVYGCRFALKRQKKNIKKEQDEFMFQLLENDTGAEGQGSSPNEKFIDEKLDMSIFNLNYSDFKPIREITSGGSGAICLEAVDKRNDEHVFIKLFPIQKYEEKADESELESFKNEVHLFTRLRHPNIVNFFGLFFQPPSRVGYVCEFCKDGTIYSFLKSLGNSKNPQNFELSKKIDWLLQIGQGMRYLHQKEVIFRDLKPENVLIGNKDVLKLTDFGISKLVSNSRLTNMTRLAGTAIYMAPEVASGGKYDSKVDVFSFGILMYEILFETLEPYGKEATFQYGIEYRVSQNPDLRPQIPDSFGGNDNDANVMVDLVELMKRCWSHDPTQRPDFREIVKIIESKTQKLE